MSASLRGVLDLVDRDQHLRRDLLVELDVLLELRDRRARQRLDLLLLAGLLDDRLGIGLEELVVLGEAQHARALAALDQHLDRAVRQLQQLQHRADGADRVDVGGGRIVLRGVLLGDEEDLLVVLHHVLERPHRLLAADEERHDHVREDDDVAQRQDGIERTAGKLEHEPSFSCCPGAVDARSGQGNTGRRCPAAAVVSKVASRRAQSRAGTVLSDRAPHIGICAGLRRAVPTSPRRSE